MVWRWFRRAIVVMLCLPLMRIMREEGLIPGKGWCGIPGVRGGFPVRRGGIRYSVSSLEANGVKSRNRALGTDERPLRSSCAV